MDHYCTKCCGPCTSVPMHEPDQEMREQCGCSWCVPPDALETLKFVRQHFDPKATSVPNAKTCLKRINAALSSQPNIPPEKLDRDLLFQQHRACMEILEDVPGETLADRVARIANWHERLSDEHHKLLSEVSTQVSDDEPLSERDQAMIDRAWAVHKAAGPVAKIINDNQPGKTAIIEILVDPPTLGVGTLLFSDDHSVSSPS